MVGHGGSSASSYLSDPTSPLPSHCASIVTTSTLRVSVCTVCYHGVACLHLQRINFITLLFMISIVLFAITQIDSALAVTVVLCQNAMIHQVTTMLATSKNVLFPCHNHLLTIGLITLHFNYHPRWCSGNNQSVGLSVPVVSRWLWPGNRTFLELASMVVTWWTVAFIVHCHLGAFVVSVDLSYKWGEISPWHFCNLMQMNNFGILHSLYSDVTNECLRSSGIRHLIGFDLSFKWEIFSQLEETNDNMPEITGRVASTETHVVIIRKLGQSIRHYASVSPSLLRCKWIVYASHIIQYANIYLADSQRDCQEVDFVFIVVSHQKIWYMLMTKTPITVKKIED